MVMAEAARRSRVAHDAVKAVCPIDGIRFAHDTDRSQWTIFPSPSATPDQIAEGQRVLMTVDLTPPPEPKAKVNDELAELRAIVAKQQAFIDALQAEAAKELGG